MIHPQLNMFLISHDTMNNRDKKAGPDLTLSELYVNITKTLSLRIRVSTSQSWRLQSLTKTLPSRSTSPSATTNREHIRFFIWSKVPEVKSWKCLGYTTYSNSPGTNRNCLWMGRGFTIDNHTTRYLHIQSRTANS